MNTRASASVEGSSTLWGMPLRVRKLRSRATPGEFIAPTSTGPPEPVSIKRHAPQDQGAHELLAQQRLGDQQRMQLVRIDEQGLHRADRSSIHERTPAGELPQLSGETARAMLDHRQVVPVAVAPGDANVARDQHVHAGTRLADLEEVLAVGVVTHGAEAAHAFDLGRGQREEGLAAPGIKDGAHGLGLEFTRSRRNWRRRGSARVPRFAAWMAASICAALSVRRVGIASSSARSSAWRRSIERKAR